jgi:DNA-binding CsgD family transcriptional regulator
MEEVAMILGFASRAVKLHLDKARRDLAAINVVHAVVVAVRRGFGPCCVFPLC